MKKNSTLKKTSLIAFFCLIAMFKNNAQCVGNPICPMMFGNSLYCGQTISANWHYVTGATNCGFGSVTNLASGAQVPMNCGGCSGPITDFVITVTAINGCAITPPISLNWSTACGGPNGIGAVTIPCLCTPTPNPPLPPGSYCCDGSTSLIINTAHPQAAVN